MEIIFEKLHLNQSCYFTVWLSIFPLLCSVRIPVSLHKMPCTTGQMFTCIT